MKILISGATGLVGTRLLEVLTLKGFDDLRVLTRNKDKTKNSIPFPVEFFNWNPEKNYLEEGALDNVDVIIHLAGENIADGRWVASKKKRILESRQVGSELLISEIKKLPRPPKKFISSSAVGIYGDTKDREVTTASPHASDFLATVCEIWESTVLNHGVQGMKAHCLRTGVVLAAQGGALQKMLPAFYAGVAGRLGSGKQYMSWIHIDDLVNQFIFLIENEGQSHIYNATAPNPLTNKEFTKILGAAIKRPTLFPVPGIALKILFGEMSDILLKGQRAIPAEFLKEGFKFKFGNVKDALVDILKFSSNGETVLKKYQWINKPVVNVFKFFSDQNNLEQITPPYLNFKVLGRDTDQIKQGTHINYKLKIHGIPFKWKTEISSFVENKTFTDIQLKGPYAKWVHQHDFIPCKQGTLIRDEVVYKVPMGMIGKLFAGYFVKRDVQHIFKYRSKVLEKQFS